MQIFKHKIALGYDVSDHPLARVIAVCTGAVWIGFGLLLLEGFQSEVADRLLGEYLRAFVAFLIAFNMTVIYSNMRKSAGGTLA